MKTIRIFLTLSILGFMALSMTQHKPKNQEIILTINDVVWADSVWKGTTLGDLKTGQDLFNNHCDACHKFHYPNELKAEKWQTIIPKMAKKSELTEQQGELVLKFVITAGRSDRLMP